MGRFGWAAAIALAAAGCVSSDAGGEKQVSAAPPTPEGLPGQRLEPGECGLFIWSKTDLSQFVFFTKAGERRALFLVDNEPKEALLIEAGGDLLGQFYTTSFYQVAGLVQPIELRFKPGETLESGQRIDSGRIIRTSAEGWRTITPVAGVSACQPE